VGEVINNFFGSSGKTGFDGAEKREGGGGGGADGR